MWDTLVMHTRILTRTLFLLSVLLLLRYTPFERLDNLAVLIIAGVIAIPIAAYRIEYRLFARRAVLSSGCREGTLAQRWLWRGSLAKIASYLTALVISGLILVTLSAFDNWEWLLMFTAAGALTLLEAMTLPFARDQAREAFLPVFHRGLIKWPIICLVTLASALVAFNSDYPRYPAQDVVPLAQQAFDVQLNRFTSPLLGYSRALLAASDTVVMYLAQQHVPRVEDRAAQWAFWLYFSVKSAVAAGLVVYLLLGLLTLLSTRERRGWRLLGRTVFEKYFTLTLVVLIAVYLYAASIRLAPPDPSGQQAAADCEQARRALQDFTEERRRELTTQEQALRTSVNSDIEQNLARIFAGAEAGVDRYLDWYFSVVGEYQRLAATLLGRFGQDAPDKLDTLVLDDINAGLGALNLKLEDRIVAGINQAARFGDLALPQWPGASDCLPAFSFTPPVFEDNPVFVGQPQAVVTGGAIAALTAKKVMAKASAKGAGKVAGKYGASFATGLTAATFCGPLAAVCGVGAAGLAWVAVDAGIVTADEMLNREEMRRDILANLDEQQNLIRNRMIDVYSAAIAARYDRIEDSFRISEDGF